MNDREQLELAAKAAGMRVLKDPHEQMRDCTGAHYAINIFSLPLWNPLTDDGDALRLAVKLGLLEHSWLGDMSKESDPYAATRRAIVKAAAEIGK